MGSVTAWSAPTAPVRTGVPVYLLLAWADAEPPPTQRLREPPSRMLNAKYAVVDFTGRAAELDDLRRWRTESPRLAVRWLHGPGGQGKTPAGQ